MYTVQVLLSTYNGETYLKQQLDSILNQKNVAVKLFVRDDGSSDGTVDILRAYAALHDNICYLCGENCGVVASFFRLFELSDPDVDFYALSDQDDVWDEDKLSIACQKLEQMRKSKSPKKKKNDSQIRTFATPLLYCCDAWNTDDALNLLPESMQTAGKELVPDFRNALIENIARGASIVFNQHLCLISGSACLRISICTIGGSISLLHASAKSAMTAQRTTSTVSMREMRSVQQPLPAVPNSSAA